MPSHQPPTTPQRCVHLACCASLETLTSDADDASEVRLPCVLLWVLWCAALSALTSATDDASEVRSLLVLRHA